MLLILKAKNQYGKIEGTLKINNYYFNQLLIDFFIILDQINKIAF